MLKDRFAGCTPAVRHCRGRRPRRPAGQAALCWLCVGRPAHRPPRTSAIAGKFAVRRPTYKPQKGRQRFPVGADSISARGSSRRRALSSGRGPGMPGPYRVAIVPGGMTFLRAMRRAACPQAAADVCHSGKVRGSPPHIQTAKGAAAVSRGRDAAIFLREAQKNPPPSGAENDGGKTQ